MVVASSGCASLAQLLQRDRPVGGGQAVQLVELAVPGDLAGLGVLLEAADTAQPLGVLQQARQARHLVLHPPDQQDAVRRAG